MPYADPDKQQEAVNMAVRRYRGQIPSQEELDIIERINATHDTIIGLENSIIAMECDLRKARREHRAKKKAENEQKKVEK